MPSDADRVIQVLREGHDDLATLIEGWDDDDLAAPSGASEWDVSEVLSHLGSGAEIAWAGLQANLAGSDLPGQDFNQSVWDRWNAASRADRAARYVQVDEQLVAGVEALDDEVRQSLRVTLPWMPEPIDLATVLSFRVSEQAMHSWDARVAFDDDARLRPAAVELLTDVLGERLAFLGRADAIAGDAVIGVETTDPDRRLRLGVTDAVTIESMTTDDAGGEVDGTLRLPAESWLRLLTGRLAAGRTPATVVLESDRVTLDDLRRMFPGY